MKKGFTLIELLAVIVILAIIALIATPIILGIINDARKESNERSAELYASAVRNAVAAYQLTGTTSPAKFSDLDIQYDGNVVCTTQELYADGSFYIADCTVNGTAVDYTYGEKQVTQVYKPQYYSWSSMGSIGGDLPNDAKVTVVELNPGKPFYLGFDVDANNKLITTYSCFVRNNTEYCLKGTTDGSAFTTNTDIIKDAFADVVDTDACSFDGGTSRCLYDGLDAIAYSDGTVSVDDNSSAACEVYGPPGEFCCYEW